MSKYSIEAVWNHIDDKFGKSKIFSRDCPEIGFKLPGGHDVWVLCNHFKNEGYGQQTTSDTRHKSQAKRVKGILFFAFT